MYKTCFYSSQESIQMVAYKLIENILVKFINLIYNIQKYNMKKKLTLVKLTYVGLRLSSESSVFFLFYIFTYSILSVHRSILKLCDVVLKIFNNSLLKYFLLILIYLLFFQTFVN